MINCIEPAILCSAPQTLLWARLLANHGQISQDIVGMQPASRWDEENIVRFKDRYEWSTY